MREIVRRCPGVHVPWCLGVLVMGLLLATSNQRPATVFAEEPTPPPPAVAGPRVEAVDTNEDGTPDEWRTYEGERLVEVTRDRDGDGVAEVRILFDETGAPVRSEMDRNGDGTADLTRWLKRGRAEKERGDLNFDGKDDVWSFFTEVGTKDLMIMDKNYDGRPDAWFYYDSTGWKLRGSRLDEDYDGTIDRTFGQVPEGEEARKPW